VKTAQVPAELAMGSPYVDPFGGQFDLDEGVDPPVPAIAKQLAQAQEDRVIAEATQGLGGIFNR
jgi:hypothetical protein